MMNYNENDWKEPCPKVDCKRNCNGGMKTITIPAALGDDSSNSKYAPKNGAYCNAIVKYEANGHIYLYGSDGVPTYIQSGSGGVDNFDALHGKPKYAGREMTSWTDIPEVVAPPTQVSQLVNDSNYQTESEVAASIASATSPIESAVTAVEGIAATALQPNDINKIVVSDVHLDTTPSTTSVQLEEGKVNLMSGATSTSSIALPVASSTQAGVMNSATFDAIATNASNINAILNGAVAISGISASPSQSDLTTAWQNETGLTALINRASIFDVTNNKVWTYYSNDTTWHEAANTTQVTVGTFTNSSEGSIKGSTVAGQVFAESDGTGSVNGWDNLVNSVSTATSKLATIAQGAEVNVQSDWAQTSTTADSYIKNKPTIPTKTSQLTNDSNYVTQTSLNSKLTAANLTASGGLSKTTSGSGSSTAVDVSIASSGVTTAKIASSAVTTAKIANNAVTASKIDFSTIGPQIASASGSGGAIVSITPKVSGGIIEVEAILGPTWPYAGGTVTASISSEGGSLTRFSGFPGMLSGGDFDGRDMVVKAYFRNVTAGTTYKFTPVSSGSGYGQAPYVCITARYYPGG